MKIKSKKRSSPYRLFFKFNIFSLIQNSILKYFFVIIFALFSSLCLIFYGANLQKNQTTAKIQQLLFNSINTKLNVVNNYISGLFAKYHKIYLDIKFEDIQLLNFARDRALSKGVITEEEQKISIRANLNLNNQKYEVKLSPTGLNLDMIGDKDKRAYKAKNESL